MESDERDARWGLDEVEAGRRAAREAPDLPSWFVPSLAVLVAVLFLAQLLPNAAAIAVGLADAVLIGALAGAQMRASGVVALRHMPDRRLVLAWTGLLVVLVAACVALDAAGVAWAWVVGAALAGGAMLVLGRVAAERP